MPKPIDAEAEQGRSPKATKFKKGGGRKPRRARTGPPETFASVMAEVLEETVAVTEGGVSKRRTYAELITMQLARKAAKGESAAVIALLLLKDNADALGDLKPSIIETCEEEMAII